MNSKQINQYNYKEYLEHFEKHFDKIQKELNPFVTKIDIKKQVEQLENQELPLYGVGVAIKDNINTKGVLTTASSNILSNYIPIYDATIIRKIKNAGGILVAKTSLDELGMGGTSMNAHTGPVNNPYDTTRIAGGSSGGSAVSVASGLVSIAIGSDTGDSIRKPASFCGIVGFKPTYGRISRYGVIPYASSLDHLGFFTTTVYDSAKMLEICAGYDPLDVTSLEAPVEKYTTLLNKSLKMKKVGIIKNIVDRIKNKDVINSFNKVVENLKKQGIEVVEVEYNDQLLKTLLPTYLIISNAEATANHSNLDGIRFGNQITKDSLEETMIATRTNGFSSLVKRRFVLGSYSLFEENQLLTFEKAKKVRRLIVEELNKKLEEVDFLIAPASGGIAPKKAELDQLDRYSIVENHMLLGNFSGYPSITLPMGFSNEMPLGINITAGKLQEASLLALAQTIENITQLGNCVKEGW